MAIGIEDVFERLRGSPTWREAEEAAHKELIGKRREAADRVAAAEREFQKAAPKLRKAVEKASEARDEAWRAWLEADAAAGEAERELRAAAASVDAARRPSERYLRDTADSRIDDFIRDLEREHEEGRNLQPELSGGRKVNVATGKRGGAERWTLPSLRAYLAGLRAARAAAEALKLEPSPDIDARLAEIRAAIPDPTVMVPIRPEDMSRSAA